MTEAEAHALLSANPAISPGKFYGANQELGLGAGLIYEAIRCPIFDVEDRLFSTVELPVYVFTHECDVDSENNRVFNDYLTICPLIPIRDFLEEHAEWFNSDVELGNFLGAVARRTVSRVIYLPPGPNQLQYGALMYLNQMVSTHVDEFESIKPITSVSAYGLQIIDKSFENHFLRPKSDRLSFGPMS